MTRPDLDHEWERIAVTRRGSVTEVRLHRDGGPLVWDPQIHRELPQLFQALGDDKDTKVVLLTGTGDSFCAEIDLPAFKHSTGAWENTWLEGSRLLNNLVDLPMPVVSAIRGPARFHAEIPLLADIVLADQTAVFADKAHFTRGTPPGDGVHLVWLNLLGPNRGRSFLLLGSEIDANEALRLGLVAEVTQPESLLIRAHEIADELAALPRPTLMYAKAAINITLRRLFAEGLSHGLALEGLAYFARGGIIDPAAQ
jgi:enoyl-CoA hydratase/carnithine racemase